LDIKVLPRDLLKVCTMANQLKHKTEPRCNFIKVTTEEGRAKFRFTNLEQMAIVDFGANIKDVGECYIPIKRTTQLAKFEKNPINISTDTKKNMTKLSSMIGAKEGFNVSLFVDKFEDVPIPNIEGTEFELPTDFQKRLGYAIHCVALDPSRPVLTGLELKYDGNFLNATTADGFRLINVTCQPHIVTNSFNVIIPGDAIQSVIKNMSGAITFGYNKERCWFKNKQNGMNMMIISQLVYGSYPKWESLIPSTNPTWTFTVSAPILAQRLQQFGNDGMKIVRYINREGTLTLTERIEELEETEMVVPAKMVGDGKIAFSKDYILGISKLFSEMKCEVTSTSNPMKVTGDLEGVTYVLMPMCVQW